MMLLPTPGRPLPDPTWLTQPFWDGANERRLLVQRCNDCLAYIFRPEAACKQCLSEDWQWTESSGLGIVHSFSIVMRPAVPELVVPYVVAAIELDEGWHLITNIIGCEETDVHIGMRVRVAFVPIDGMHLPFFEPVVRPAELDGNDAHEQ